MTHTKQCIITGVTEEEVIKEIIDKAKGVQNHRKLSFLVSARWYSAPEGRVDVYVGRCDELDLTVVAYCLDDLLIKAHKAAKMKVRTEEGARPYEEPYVVFEFPGDIHNRNGAVINVNSRDVDRRIIKLIKKGVIKEDM